MLDIQLAVLYVLVPTKNGANCRWALRSWSLPAKSRRGIVLQQTSRLELAGAAAELPIQRRVKRIQECMFIGEVQIDHESHSN